MRMNKSTACAVAKPPQVVIGCENRPANIGFAAFNAACVSMACIPMVNAAPQPTRETTMMDQEIEQRSYILERTFSVQRQKDLALEEFFNLRDDARPMSPEDLIKRIQDGKYVLESKDEFDDEDEFCFSNNFDRLHWRDPAKVRDQVGYKAAEKNLKEAVQKLQDKARLYTIAEATKAFEEFQATDFTTVH